MSDASAPRPSDSPRCSARAPGARILLVLYMAMVLSLLLIALRFVRPTQMVFRLDQPQR
ncbi:MAG: hypothetical protein HY002_01660 [Candidatus Rokubacteria bacterium]|nr:hypothetical protein [Candidatus Rokubacteria bacterium]